MNEQLSKLFRDLSFALIATAIPILQQWLSSGGLDGTWAAAYAAGIMVALDVIRRFLFPAPPSEPVAKADELNIVNALPPASVTLKDEALDDPLLTSAAIEIENRFRIANPSTPIRTFDPMLIATLITMLVQLVQACRKPAAEMHANLKSARGIFAFRKRRELNAMIAKLAPDHLKSVRRELADAVIDTGAGAGDAQFEQFVAKAVEAVQ